MPAGNAVNNIQGPHLYPYVVRGKFGFDPAGRGRGFRSKHVALVSGSMVPRLKTTGMLKPRARHARPYQSGCRSAAVTGVRCPLLLCGGTTGFLQRESLNGPPAFCHPSPGEVWAQNVLPLSLLFHRYQGAGCAETPITASMPAASSAILLVIGVITITPIAIRLDNTAHLRHAAPCGKRAATRCRRIEPISHKRTRIL